MEFLCNNDSCTLQKYRFQLSGTSPLRGGTELWKVLRLGGWDIRSTVKWVYLGYLGCLDGIINLIDIQYVGTFMVNCLFSRFAPIDTLDSNRDTSMPLCVYSTGQVLVLDPFRIISKVLVF